MAVVTRYFSTASAGGRTGATWADRAMLFPSNIAVNSGTWSAAFTPGETITQTGTGATAVVELAGGSGVVFYVSSTAGSPNNSGVWTGGTSASTVTPTAVPVANQWSRVITEFDFSGADSLECRIGPGTYTCAQNLANGLFATAPTIATNSVMCCGCDSSGNAIGPADPGWISPQGLFDDSAYPVIATTTNIVTVTLAASWWRCVKFTASANITGLATGGGSFDWCSFVQTTVNSTAAGVINPKLLTNCQIVMNTATFSAAILLASVQDLIDNVRLDGSAGVTSGNRRGFTAQDNGHNFHRMTFIKFAGGGVLSAKGSVARFSNYSHCTFVDCGTYGIQCNATASQTARHHITNSYFSGATYGIDANNAKVIAVNNRLRDHTSGNFFNFGNYSTDYNYTTNPGGTPTENDATEFVNPAAGDYRIKNTATLVWGKGYGAGDEPAAGGGGLLTHPGMSGGFRG